MRLWWLWLLLPFVGIVLVASGLLIRDWVLRPHIDQDTYNRIQLGMTHEEVFSAIGSSPYNDGSWRRQHCYFHGKEGVTSEEWAVDGLAIKVHYDSDRQVVGKEICAAFGPELSWLDKVLQFFADLGS